MTHYVTTSVVSTQNGANYLQTSVKNKLIKVKINPGKPSLRTSSGSACLWKVAQRSETYVKQKHMDVESDFWIKLATERREVLMWLAVAFGDRPFTVRALIEIVLKDENEPIKPEALKLLKSNRNTFANRKITL